MNVTTITNLVTSAQSDTNKKIDLTDGTAFSQELKKQLKQKTDTEAEAVTEDSSQSEVNEKTEELEDTDDFVIIPTFLRFDRELEKTPTVLTDLHKDTLYMESTTEQDSNSALLLNYEETLGEKTDLSHSVIHSEKIKMSADTMGAIEEHEKVKLSEFSEEKNFLVKDTESISVSLPEKLMEEPEKSADTVNILKNTDTLETKEKLVEKDKTDFQAVNSEEIVKEKELKTSLLNSKEKALNSLTAPFKKTGQQTDSQTTDFLSERLTDKSSQPVVSGQKGQESSKSAEHSVAQPFTSAQFTQLNSETSQLSQSIPVPITLEQSTEVISDMIMSVSVNETGEAVYESTLTLTPETMGDIKVVLSYSEEKLQGNILFETEEAKEFFENNWLQVKSSLELKGLQLDRFDFQVIEPESSNQSGFSDNFSKESGQSKQDQEQNRKETVHTTLNPLEDEEGRQRPIPNKTSGLNYYA